MRIAMYASCYGRNVQRPNMDVLNVVPTIVENDGMGEMPDIINIDPLSTAKDFAEAVFDFVVDCLEGLANLAVRMVELGLEVIGELTSAVASAVEEFVDGVVDAFTAFVDWAVEFIQAMIETIFGPVAQAINDVWTAYWQGVSSALNATRSDYLATGGVSPSSLGMLSDALGGDLFLVILGVTAAVSALLIALTAVTNVFSFLLSVAMSALVGFLFSQAFNTITGTVEMTAVGCGSSYEEISVDMIEQFIEASESEHPPAGSEEEYERGVLCNVIAAAIGVLGAHIGMAALSSSSTRVMVAGVVGIVGGLTAAALGAAASIADNDLVGYVAIYYGFVSVAAGIISIPGGTAFQKGAGIASVGFGFASLSLSVGELLYEG